MYLWSLAFWIWYCGEEMLGLCTRRQAYIVHQILLLPIAKEVCHLLLEYNWRERYTVWNMCLYYDLLPTSSEALVSNKSNGFFNKLVGLKFCCFFLHKTCAFPKNLRCKCILTWKFGSSGAYYEMIHIFKWTVISSLFAFQHVYTLSLNSSFRKRLYYHIIIGRKSLFGINTTVSLYRSYT